MVWLSTQYPKIKPPLGVTINASHPLAQGLISWWLMNEGGGAYANDILGKHRGTLNGSPGWTTGLFGPALDFTAVSGKYIDYGVTSDTSPANVTISAWVKYQTARNYDLIAGTTDFGSNGFRIWYNIADGSITPPAGNSLIFSINAYNVAYARKSFTADNLWHHVVATYDGAHTRLFVDTVEGLAGTTSAAITYTGAQGRIGFATGWQDWEGPIENVMLYNRALSLPEIQLLYLQPFAPIEMPIMIGKGSAPAGTSMFNRTALDGLSISGPKQFNRLEAA